MSWYLTGPLLYMAAAAFVAGTAYRLISLLRMPRHLRWELYPIPHLGPAGSKYQQMDFAGLPPHRSRLREMVFMTAEILLLKKLFVHRRSLWFGSWLLHAGLYLCIAMLMLLGAAALLTVVGWMPTSGLGGALRNILPATTAAAGGCGLVAGLTGTVVLFVFRLADRGLRDMSDGATFFHLIFLAAVFGTGLFAWLTVDPGLVHSREHLISLLRGRPGTVESPSLALAMVVAGLFIGYLPFSRMFHFAAKYFFYHRVLWDERSMAEAGAMQRDIAGYLSWPVTWSAEHVKAGRSWQEQVSPANGTTGEADDS